MLTRASFFQGHEWLTFLANEDLPRTERFSNSEIREIAEGNRRVDWPKEMLVHLNVSILAYSDALIEYTDRPEVQRFHFLLDNNNDSAQAAADAHGTIREWTLEALLLWGTNRVKALSLLG